MGSMEFIQCWPELSRKDQRAITAQKILGVVQALLLLEDDLATETTPEGRAYGELAMKGSMTRLRVLMDELAVLKQPVNGAWSEYTRTLKRLADERGGL